MSEPNGPVERVVVAKAHSGDSDYTPERCDFALVYLTAATCRHLTFYRDELAALAVRARERFPGSATSMYELKVWLGWIEFVGYHGTELEFLEDDDPLHALIETAMEEDRAALLPAGFDLGPYRLEGHVADTDTNAAIVSADGVRFYAYSGDTRVSTTEVAWDVITEIAAGEPDA
jgi:hypothetical protein